MHITWKPVALAAMLAVTATTAYADSANFKSPSGNIFCGYFDYDGPPEVRCDIRNSRPPSASDLPTASSTGTTPSR